MFECGELITICENVEADQADLNPSIGMRAVSFSFSCSIASFSL